MTEEPAKKDDSDHPYVVVAVDVLVALLGFGALAAVVFALVQLYEASLLGHISTARKVIGL